MHPDPTDHELADAVAAVRAMMTASDQYRLQAAGLAGLAVSDTFALSHLHAGGPLPQGELARLVGVSTSGATVLVDRLEAAGVARRHTDANDRRRVTVELTAAGRDIVDRSGRRLRHALDRVDRSELATATRLLTTVAADLRRQAVDLRVELSAQRTGG